MDIPLTISDIEFWFRYTECTPSTWPDVTGDYVGTVGDMVFTDGVPTFSSTARVILGILPNFSEWTIMGYVKPTIIDQIGGFLITDQGGYNNDVLFGIRPETGAGGEPPRRFCLDHQDLTTSTRTIAYDSIDATTDWTSVCATSDGDTLRLYVNGILVSSTSRNGSELTWGSGVQTTYIGYNAASSSRSWKGQIQHIMAYTRALSANEITSIHNFVSGISVVSSGNMFLMF